MGVATRVKLMAYNLFYGTQAAGTTRSLLIQVAGTELHLRDFGIKTDQGPFHGTLYEAPFVDVNSLGVQAPFNNLNRKSSNVSDTVLYNTPFLDTNSLGTELDHGSILAASGAPIKQIAGELATLTIEWVLKPDTYYAAVFVNSSTNDATFTQYIIGYEPA